MRTRQNAVKWIWCLKVVADFPEVWFRERGRLTFHDPLAVVGIFTNNVLTYRSGTVAIDLSNEDKPGRTDFTNGAYRRTQRI